MSVYAVGIAQNVHSAGGLAAEIVSVTPSSACTRKPPLFFIIFFGISRTADVRQCARLPISPTATLPPYLCSQSILPTLPGSRLMNFYRDASSALLQLVKQMVELLIIAGVRGYLLIDRSGDDEF